MLNYIKAELYRNFNRLYFWLYTLIIAAIAALLVIPMNGHIKFTSLFEFVPQMAGMGIYLLLPMIDMITGEEQKNRTLKNIVSFGISRNKLVFSKIISTILLGLISVVIILGALFISGAVVIGVGTDFSLSIVGTFLLKFLVYIVLWIAALSIGTFFALFFKNNTMFSFMYAGVFIFTSKIIKLLTMLVSDKFEHVNKFLITTQFEKVATGNDLTFSLLVGIVYIIVFIGINIAYVKNMEIK